VHDPSRVLIVDDNENNRAILAARLGAQGYLTSEACDGAEALEAVRRDAPDLVLLDVSMPRMDGLEACRRLRSDPSVGFVPIILVTARADSKDVVAGLEAGADEYLTKPVDQQALVARVRSTGKDGLPPRPPCDLGDLGPVVAGHPRQPALRARQPVDRDRGAVGVEQRRVAKPSALDDVAALDRDGDRAVLMMSIARYSRRRHSRVQRA
jgi:CheY-like chemotaxis protein